MSKNVDSIREALWKYELMLMEFGNAEPGSLAALLNIGNVLEMIKISLQYMGPLLLKYLEDKSLLLNGVDEAILNSSSSDSSNVDSTIGDGFRSPQEAEVDLIDATGPATQPINLKETISPEIFGSNDENDDHASTSAAHYHSLKDFHWKFFFCLNYFQYYLSLGRHLVYYYNTQTKQRRRKTTPNSIRNIVSRLVHLLKYNVFPFDS
jgi:hypothetical protein